jgi:hypothetical protein
MTWNDRLWLNGFSTMSKVLENERLAMAELRQALDDDRLGPPSPLDAWRQGLDAGVRACFGE